MSTVEHITRLSILRDRLAACNTSTFFGNCLNNWTLTVDRQTYTVCPLVMDEYFAFLRGRDE